MTALVQENVAQAGGMGADYLGTPQTELILL